MKEKTIFVDKAGQDYSEEQAKIIVNLHYAWKDEKSISQIAEELHGPNGKFPARSLGALRCKISIIVLFLAGKPWGKDKYLHIGGNFIAAMTARYDKAFIIQRIKDNEKWRMKETGVKNPRNKVQQEEKEYIQENQV